MQNLKFNFFFLFSFLFLIIKPLFSEEASILDLNQEQKVIVNNALSSCKDADFENLLKTRKEKL